MIELISISFGVGFFIILLLSLLYVVLKDEMTVIYTSVVHLKNKILVWWWGR